MGRKAVAAFSSLDEYGVGREGSYAKEVDGIIGLIEGKAFGGRSLESPAKGKA